MPPATAPPLIVDGEAVNDFTVVGPTVSDPAAEPPFSVAVIVTGVDDAT